VSGKNASLSQEVPVREDGSYEETIRFFHGNLIGKPYGILLIISAAIIKLYQTADKNDSDRNVIAKHVSVFEQSNRLRVLFI
jgi:hypothetical protein